MSAEVIQGSEEWKRLRLGKLTASRVADATAKTKSGYSASRDNLKAALICERLTGEAQDTYVNAAMAWGTEQEPTARQLYELMMNVDVAQVGFVEHPTISMSGASPDGLTPDNGLIEIKCPGSAKHIETLLTEKIDGKYLKQMAWQMACTGRAYVDFVSFDPRLPAEMQLFIKRVHRDAVMIAELEQEARVFLKEVDDTISQLTAKFGAMEAA